VKQGTALYIIFEEMSEKTISTALNELLTHPKYKEKAERISARIKDRPMTPKQAVVYWTEFVARHKDSPYFHSIASKLSFIQLHLIDVYLVIFIGFLVIILVNIKLLKVFLLDKYFGKSDKITKMKKNQ
jgi:hypothetical protein